MKRILSVLLLLSSFASFGQNTRDYILSQWPPEDSVGLIYSKAYWTNLADFGLGTGGATATLNGNFIDIKCPAGAAYNNFIRVLPNRPTILDNWKITVRFKITVWDALSQGFGVGVRSTNTHIGNDVMGWIGTLNTGAAGMTITSPSGSGGSVGATYATGTGATNHLNDVVELTFALANDSTYIFTSQNITTASAVTTVTYNVPLNSTHFLPNGCTFAVYSLNNAGTGTQQIQKLEITSNSVTNANWLLVGPSIPQGYYANSYAGRFGNQMNALFPNFEIWADGGGQSTDILARIREIIKLNPRHVLCVACNVNDITYGVAGGLTNAQATAVAMVNIDSINNLLTAAGIDTWYATTPQDSTQGGTSLGALNNAMKAKFPLRTAPFWDSLTTAGNNILRPAFQYTDHIHINQAGQDQMRITALASSANFKTIEVNRQAPYRVSGVFVSPRLGDSIISQIDVPIGYIAIGDGRGGLISGVLLDRGSYVTAAINQLTVTTPIAGKIFQVDNGALDISGQNGSLVIQDRSTPTTYGALYMDVAFLRFNLTGTDYTGVNQTGDWVFTSGGPTFSNNGLRKGIFIKKDATIAGDAFLSKGAGLTLDSATYTYTSTGPITEFAYAKFNIPTVTAAAGINATHSATVTIQGAPTFAGSASTSDNSAFRIAKGAFEIGFDVTDYNKFLTDASGNLSLIAAPTTGKFLIGTATDNSTGQVQIQSTSQQFGINYDASNYLKLGVASNGDATFSPFTGAVNAGNFILKGNGVFEQINSAGTQTYGSIVGTATGATHWGFGHITSSAFDNYIDYDPSGNVIFPANVSLVAAGTLTLPVGAKIVSTTGAGARAGQTTLVAGTKAITIAGLTTSSLAFITLVTPTGVTLTTSYQAVCTTNTLTIQSNVAAGTINTADGSVLNYFIIN